VPDKEANKKRVGAAPRPSVPKGSEKSVGSRQTPGDAQGLQTTRKGPPPGSATR
jgi:hypothetical protein